MNASRVSLAVALLVAAGGCQNADLLRPETPPESASRGFTPIGGDERAPLTNDTAMRRMEGVRQLDGQPRLDAIDSFLAEFPEARFIADLHQLGGEAELALHRADRAAEAFERALVLTRTDLLGIPLETQLPVQVATARLAAGDEAGALVLLARLSVVEETPQVQQALAYAWGSASTSASYEDWLAQLRDEHLVRAPRFSLPGLQGEDVSLQPAPATIINFWSPT